MMQALAEGYEIIYNSEFNYNLAKISHWWNRGIVIRSWLIELMAETFHNDTTLDNLKGVMNMNGEGIWTAQEALIQGTPAPIIALSVIMRQRSQQNDTFAGKEWLKHFSLPLVVMILLKISRIWDFVYY